MNQRFSSLLGLVVGVLAIKMTLTGDYLNYVRPGMFVWLLISGVVLVVLGVVGWLAARKDHEGQGEVCSTAGHSHSCSRAALLLTLPVLVVGLTLPAPLGSFAASRQTVRPPRQVTDMNVVVEGLLNESDAVEPDSDPLMEDLVYGRSGDSDEMGILTFLDITYYDETKAIAGIPVRIEGFAMPSPNGAGDSFLLSRFMINCCAADATLLQVGVGGLKSPVPQQDAWVSVTGRWYPDKQTDQLTSDGFTIPQLVADKVEAIPAPENPYANF